MRRSICLSEPNIALAGEEKTWNFSFVTSQTLPQKTLLRFDPLSSGEGNEWELPEIGTRAKKNAIWVTLPDGKTLSGKEVNDDGHKQFEFILPKEVPQGEKLTFHLGSNEGGNRSQLFIQRRRPFHLYINTKGKKDFKDPEIFTLDVRGNQLRNIRIIAPSIVSRNSRFDVFIRFEDAFGNLTGHAPEETLIELSYDQLRENLNWKLFVPETGFLTLPNLYFNEPGLYRLRLKNLKTGEEFISAPMQCYAEEGLQQFWGVLRGEVKRFNMVEETESVLRYFRDDQALQFFATSTNEETTITTSDDWKLISSQVAEFNEEERFVTMLGFQWEGEPSTEGIRHMIYHKDHKPLLRKKELKSNTLKKIYRAHTPKEFLSIPCLTMGKGHSYNFDDFHPEFERVVEIYSSWGSCETSAKKGNPRPLKGTAKKGISEVEEGAIIKALMKGCRFGFVASALTSQGSFQEMIEAGQETYSPGLTAILSSEYSRDALFAALYARNCYATTGSRILLSFNIASKPMGTEISTSTKPGLLYNRHIHGFVAGTDEIEEITIIRNGEVIQTLSNGSNYFKIEVDDDTPLEEVVRTAPLYPHPHVFYYMRVQQKDGHLAWASPIWIDLAEEEKKGKKK